MSSHTDQAALDAKFHALSDVTRRALVERLSHRPSSVKDLAQPMSVSLPSVLKHLAILESGGIVQSQKHGRVRTFRITPDAFAGVERWVAARKQNCNAQFNRLDEYLKEKNHDR